MLIFILCEWVFVSRHEARQGSRGLVKRLRPVNVGVKRLKKQRKGKGKKKLEEIEGGQKSPRYVVR